MASGKPNTDATGRNMDDTANDERPSGNTAAREEGSEQDSQQSDTDTTWNSFDGDWNQSENHNEDTDTPAPTGSHFSDSSDEDEDDNHDEVWDAQESIKAEEERQIAERLGMAKPQCAFGFETDWDPVEGYIPIFNPPGKGTDQWGPNREQYWKRDEAGTGWVYAYRRPPHGSNPLRSTAGPSHLGMVSSVDDVSDEESPESSASEYSEENYGQTQTDGVDGVHPDSSLSCTDWTDDEEEEDRAYMAAELLRLSAPAITSRSAEQGQRVTDEVTPTEEVAVSVAEVNDEQDDEPMPSVRDQSEAGAEDDETEDKTLESTKPVSEVHVTSPGCESEQTEDADIAAPPASSKCDDSSSSTESENSNSGAEQPPDASVEESRNEVADTVLQQTESTINQAALERLRAQLILTLAQQNNRRNRAALSHLEKLSERGDRLESVNEELISELQRLDHAGRKLRDMVDSLRQQHANMIAYIEEQDSNLYATQDAKEELEKTVKELTDALEHAQELADAEAAKKQVETKDAGTNTEEKGTDAVVPTASPTSTATQTEELSTRAVTTSARRNTSLLPRNYDRWPAFSRQTIAVYIAAWVNNAHARESSNRMPTLMFHEVESQLGANTSLDEIVSNLRELGYMFRDDRLAQGLERVYRDNGMDVNPEVMYAARGLGRRSNATLALLEEINSRETSSERNLYLHLVQRFQRAQDENSQAFDRLEDCKSKLEQCRTHGAALQKDLEKSEQLVSEFTEGMMSMEQEIDELHEKLARGQNQIASLITERDLLQNKWTRSERTLRELTEEMGSMEEEINDLREKLEEGQKQIANLVTEKESLARELRKLSEQVQALEAAHETKTKKHAADQAEIQTKLDNQRDITTDLRAREVELKQALEEAKEHAAKQQQTTDEEKVRQQSEVDTLKKTQEKHIDMLRLAHSTIETLKSTTDEIFGSDKPVTEPTNATTSAAPTTPGALPSASRASHLQSSSDAPVTPFAFPLQEHKWAKREARLKDSDTYKRTREALREKRRQGREQRDEEAALRQQILRDLCGWGEAPYVPAEQRIMEMRKMVAA